MAGTLTISTLSDGTNSTSATNPIRGSAKAWLSYNGATTTILGSYNVSSVTRNGTGNYTINFTNALANSNYAFAGSLRTTESTAGITNVYGIGAGVDSTKTTSALQIISRYYSGSFDSPEVCIIVLSS
jgi:hypothetical protein